MRKMKDSGVEWIGEIPEDWKIYKLGSLYKNRSIKVSDKNFKPLSVSKKEGVTLQLENVAKSNASDDRKLVNKGDFVINSRSDRKQSCGLSEFEGSVSLIYIVLHSKEIEKKFSKYLLNNYGFAEEFYRWGKGIVSDLWSTSYESMKKINLAIPNKILQEEIANYLDKKCEEIEGLIKIQEKEIEKLEEYKKSVIYEAVTKGLNPNAKMKDSGIEWIGEIPDDWEVLRNKNFLRKKKIICPKHTSEPILSLSKKGVIVRDIENPFGKMPETFDGYQYVKKNNLLMCLFDIDVTPRCVGLIENDGLTSPAYSQFEFIRTSNPKYFYYLFLAIDNDKAYLHLSKNLRSSLTEDNFGEITNIRPNIQTQEKIANYLDKKCEEIEELIKQKENKITKLEEYKKSLIYECVTGKREV